MGFVRFNITEKLIKNLEGRENEENLRKAVPQGVRQE